jgi:hypothetical protein
VDPFQQTRAPPTSAYLSHVTGGGGGTYCVSVSHQSTKPNCTSSLLLVLEIDGPGSYRGGHKARPLSFVTQPNQTNQQTPYPLSLYEALANHKAITLL